MKQYRELYRQIENGREVIGRIILENGIIAYENIPDALKEEFDFWGITVAKEKYTPTSNPVVFFKVLQFGFLQGRIRVSEIKEEE